jgi:hypothetical protein
MKRYRVRVAPRSSRVAVREEQGDFKVFLTSPAQDGRANSQLIEVIAGHLGVKRYQVRILQGESSRIKIIGVDT